MNMISNKRFGKLFIAASLSLTVALSTGTMLLNVPSAHAATASNADNIIATGKQFLGVSYKFGAKSGQTSAFDCSSFTQFVFMQNGISIPRSSRQQSNVGTFVPRDQLQAGDLIFSDTNRDGVINHVSIYMGNGQLLHTYRVGIGVTISKFSGSTWDRTYVTARRVLPTNGQPIVTNPQEILAQPQSEKTPSTSKYPEYKKPSNGENQENED
ncbi:C40 family peptidase [Paenibacillus sp. sgz302251]|uniref:C40 family peptidase n=1 Tax=Paenibacillus sp. sgz302251 TaxID=3414493 RepID=UPI003C7ED42E